MTWLPLTPYFSQDPGQTGGHGFPVEQVPPVSSPLLLSWGPLWQIVCLGALRWGQMVEGMRLLCPVGGLAGFVWPRTTVLLLLSPDVRWD